MEWGQQVKQGNEQALQSFYQTTGKRFERVERKSLIIDSSTSAAHKTFSLTLHEPLTIDKLSDVYLDSFTTYNCVQSNAAVKSWFLLGINELNTNSNSAATTSDFTNKTFNKILIPNSQSGTTLDVAVTHKNKKFNYICSINPTTISSVNGSVTLIDGSSTAFADTGRFIAEFVFVARD